MLTELRKHCRPSQSASAKSAKMQEDSWKTLDGYKTHNIIKSWFVCYRYRYFVQ
jgi:hypothetical protein